MPINEFAHAYAESGISRFHMPAHKGFALHGLEPLDLTEISGADFLYQPEGIIAESERLTSEAFGSAATCYSAEGSSLSIKSALMIVRRFLGRDITAAAPRNCHRAFLDGCALIDIDPVWIMPDSARGMLCECSVSAASVRACLSSQKIDCVYITSPDYYGNLADISGISAVCREYGAFLIVDNAHGAYLRFLEPSLHPLDIGADIVCDSAHKTLPVYTGGAYLHISRSAPREFVSLAKSAMSMFGSTSPSYLIMESLDVCAGLLNADLPEKIRTVCRRTAEVKRLMLRRGIPDLSAEPMKITVDCAKIGYTGGELAELMRQAKMECEYSDPRAVVLMLSPYNKEDDFKRLEDFLTALDIRGDISADYPEPPPLPEKVMTLREAMLSAAKRIDVDSAVDKICARPAMSCQPSVAVLMAGEKIDPQTIKILKNYSIFQIDVL